MEQYVTEQLWACLSTAPRGQKNAIYSSVLPTHEAVKHFMSSLPVTFAPGLYSILQSPIPPDTSFFKTLPTESDNKWGVYLLTLEKRGLKTKLYVGSGTGARWGVAARLRNYDYETTLPHYVARALQERYHIVHKGLLCWMTIPSASLVPALRVLFTALEAVFTFSFWTMIGTTEYGYGMGSICRWARRSLPYGGLCSHNPLIELPAGSDTLMTAEELEAKALDYVRRHRERDKKNRELKLRQDREGHRAHETKKRKKYLDRHPGAADEAQKRSITKAVKEKRHTCDVCQHSFTKKNILRRHLRGRKHANKVAALEEAANDPMKFEKGTSQHPEVRKRMQRARNRISLQKNVEEKRYYCHVCEHAFTERKGLEQHLAGSRHAKKAALLEAAFPK